MPVPVPRQRAIPAVECGQAETESRPPTAPPEDGGRVGVPGSAEAEAAGAGVPGSPEATGAGVQGGPEAEGTVRGAPVVGVTPDTVGTGVPAAGPGASDAVGLTGVPDPVTPAALTLLLIQDDPAATPLVPDLRDSAGRPIRVRAARNLTEAERLLTDDVHCILLDLALPAPGAGACEDGNEDELAVLRHVLRLAPRHAVLALTASGDADRAAEAVRVGAQDYLFRDELDGRLLSRAIRYAVERKRSDAAERRLAEGRLRAQENARLERGLLPTPLLDGASLRFAARYRPGRSRALLGGDFYDVVRTPDGIVHAMIGDVCGHGPDEAALGVELRIAWRALTLAGLCGDELLGTLQEVLEHERDDEELFATLCTVDIDADGARARLCLAGHPAPLVVREGRAELLPYTENGPAIGMLPWTSWPRMEVELGSAWSLLMYTDGLIEGRVGGGSRERLGQDGMVGMVRRLWGEGVRGERLLRSAVREVREMNGGELADDVAVLLLEQGE